MSEVRGEWETPDTAVPDELEKDDNVGIGDPLPHEYTTDDVRPATVLHALMQQAPGGEYSESREEKLLIQTAVRYAAECLTDEDTFVLNAINSEYITFDELAKRLGTSRTQAWRNHNRALTRLRTLLLNQPEVRDRMNLEPTWNSECMNALVQIAGYREDWDYDFRPDYPLNDAAIDVHHYIRKAVEQLEQGKEMNACNRLDLAAHCAVGYLRYVGKWSLLDQHELLCSKQNDYGHGNIMLFGMTGVLVRASDKGERLLNLTKNDEIAPRNESVLDSFYDVVGYAAIAIMLKSETFELQLER